jgi:hypothetical protein
MRIYQIYYKQEQLGGLEQEYIPFYNEKTTIYFESKIMVDLINQGKHKGCDYFGVLAPAFRKKIKQTKFWGPTIANRSKRAFSPKEFEKYVNSFKPDIATLCSHQPHAVFPIAERFHKGISRAVIKIIEKLKYKVYWDIKSNIVIYFNYFVARPQVYEDYIKSLLEPAIHLMEHDPEVKKLVNINSHYKKPVTPELKAQTGYDYYPLHAFICERLINLYVAKNQAHLKTLKW